MQVDVELDTSLVKSAQMKSANFDSPSSDIKGSQARIAKSNKQLSRSDKGPLAFGGYLHPWAGLGHGKK